MATANLRHCPKPPDVRFVELCREMAKPTCTSWRKLKKLARYLRARPWVVQKITLDVDGIVEHDAKSCGFEQR